MEEKYENGVAKQRGLKGSGREGADNTVDRESGCNLCCSA